MSIEKEFSDFSSFEYQIISIFFPSFCKELKIVSKNWILLEIVPEKCLKQQFQARMFLFRQNSPTRPQKKLAPSLQNFMIRRENINRPNRVRQGRKKSASYDPAYTKRKSLEKADPQIFKNTHIRPHPPPLFHVLNNREEGIRFTFFVINLEYYTYLRCIQTYRSHSSSRVRQHLAQTHTFVHPQRKQNFDLRR